MSTRLEPARYVEVLRADAARLGEVASGGLDAAVPSCPDWTVRDLVLHVAQVYRHKIACTELQREPDPWPPEWPAAADPIRWLADSLDALVALLEERDPASPSATWYPPDQTVGFWYRRMAQETAVHRVDAELAVGALSPVAADLAVDGVDEVLELFLSGDWSDVSAEEWRDVVPGAALGTVAVRAGGSEWSVGLRPLAVDLARRAEPAGAAPAGATIDGDPSSVLLWLWRRCGDDAVEFGGDQALIVQLRAMLGLATG